MVIAVSNTVTHPVSEGSKVNLSENKIQKEVIKKFKNLGFTSKDLKWNEQGHLELQNNDSMKLHTLMLQMEKMGLNLKMTKQTLIEVC